ncbi:hypothetical protein EII34_04775 [Arachnia propionica]|uniref:Lipoprotein n=1 Tax=Arachnia propionica TaxID=1750 RepID=A0A3P1T971_9ACTN|nr:hypothetical protein [Arachnia propionica]RRD06001.1 hypothetical protein EII34_04775 [Arachnia propionica]
MAPYVLRSLLCGALSLTVGLSAGCSGVSSTSTPYADDFRQARELASSDFERAVLEDDRITREEYEEAVQRFVECVRGKGVSITPVERHGSYIYESSGSMEHYDAAAEECEIGTTRLIEPLFSEVLTNPEKLTWEEAVARCYVTAGLVEAPFSGQDLVRLLEAAGGMQKIPVHMDDNGDVTHVDDPVDQSDVPIDPAAKAIEDSEAASNCKENPAAGGQS